MVFRLYHFRPYLTLSIRLIACLFCASCTENPRLCVIRTDDCKASICDISGKHGHSTTLFTTKNIDDGLRLHNYFYIIQRLDWAKVYDGCALDSMVAADKYFQYVENNSSDEEMIAFLFNAQHFTQPQEAITLVAPDFISIETDSVAQKLTALYSNYHTNKLKKLTDMFRQKYVLPLKQGNQRRRVGEFFNSIAYQDTIYSLEIVDYCIFLQNKNILNTIKNTTEPHTFYYVTADCMKPQKLRTHTTKPSFESYYSNNCMFIKFDIKQNSEKKWVVKKKILNPSSVIHDYLLDVIRDEIYNECR